MSKVVGFKLEPIDHYTSLLEIYEEEKTVTAMIKHDGTGKSLSIVDVSIVFDKEEKLLFKESIYELLCDEHEQKYLFQAIYDAAGIYGEVCEE